MATALQPKKPHLEKNTQGPKNRVRDFLSRPPTRARKIPAQVAKRRQVKPLAATKTALGRGFWTATDPIGFRGGLNLYSYCVNQPVSYVDSDGQEPRFVQVNVGTSAVNDAWLYFNVDDAAGTASFIRADLTGWSSALAMWYTIEADDLGSFDKTDGCPTGQKKGCAKVHYKIMRNWGVGIEVGGVSFGGTVYKDLTGGGEGDRTECSACVCAK